MWQTVWNNERFVKTLIGSKRDDVMIDPVGKNSTVISATPIKLIFGLKIENSIITALVCLSIQLFICKSVKFPFT